MGISIHNAIAEASQLLRDAAIDEPRMEAGLLLAAVVGRDRTFMIAHSPDALTDEHLQTFRAFVQRRIQGEPLQYIVGHQEFFKLDFEVTPDVLIPRPETEIIIEAALDLARNDPAPFIADIGTGSGCLAISLLHELRGARAIATDISLNALRVARRNAERHNVLDRLAILAADGLSALRTDELFSLIVSNPPYVAASDFNALPREVRDYEPSAALVAGPDGLSYIRALLADAPARLRSGGYFIFEFGFGQDKKLQRLMDSKVWQLIEIRKDLQQIPRTMVLQKR